jgi:tetratricopeptide (TPR) repeat protein
MASKLLQLDLFGAPPVELREFEQLLSTPPAVPASEPAAVPVLPGQLDLLGARSTRLVPIIERLGDGQFAAASLVAGRLDEVELGRAIDALAVQIAAAPSADELAGLQLDGVLARIGTVGTAALGAAARRGVPVVVGRRLDNAPAGTLAAGKSSAAYWLLADRPVEALAATERLLAVEPNCADALVLRGNALQAMGDLASARRSWWRALRVAPLDTIVADIADAEVRGLRSEAADMELTPPEAWLPFVGLVMGVFAWSGDELVRAPTPADTFSSALARSRTARAHGRADIDARREMKQLAPLLFARMLEEGLV